MAAAYRIMPTVSETSCRRFWEKIVVGEPDECWPWTAAKNEHGYGVLTINCQNYKSHVIARFLETEEWPDGRCTLHSCDNPPCCNPAHLWLGTQLENAADRESRGRGKQPPGERCALSKLSQEQVEEIRRVYRPGYGNITALARRFGVTRDTIRDIIRRHTWKHL